MTSPSTANSSTIHSLTTDILVVGGGTGGSAAAIQAARRGAVNGTHVTLVSEYPWLGGMLTTAGVSAPDGNELEAWQTGLWGQFIRTVQQRQFQGVDHAWVSCFTYEPRIGAEILADWVEALPNLHWIRGQRLRAVERRGNGLTHASFDQVHIQAKIILDGTELGDVLALSEVPYRWGWDYASQEPSAPPQPNPLGQKYPVQLPTWVVVLQDVGASALASEILASPLDAVSDFSGAWEGYDPVHFLNYGRLPGDRFMVNWPQQGNDYGVELDRLVQSEATRQDFLQEAYWHSQAFARHIQIQLGRRYGLATETFPILPNHLGGGAFALHPYYRESRRLVGVVTVTEADILPQPNSDVAPLPRDSAGAVTAIAIGNYANDHHYPAPESQYLKLAPKSMHWGGRVTGTPFALPYSCLVPETVDGLLVCEKNISVSHIANGATRLQPLVMNVGQVAGMAAALCLEAKVQPRELAVRSLQNALLEEAIAPAAILPLLNLASSHPDWLHWQRYYLDREDLPPDGNVPSLRLDRNQNRDKTVANLGDAAPQWLQTITGVLERINPHRYTLVPATAKPSSLPQALPLITLNPTVHTALQGWDSGTLIQVTGYWNASGPWLRVIEVVLIPSENP